MRGKRPARSLAMALLATLASGSGLAALLVPTACTSGTTPNCADAAEMCDPYEAGPDSGMPSEASVAESSTTGG